MEIWGKDVRAVREYANRVRQNPPNILVILSGGMDSATTLALAHDLKPDKLHAITFNYGQKHSNETIQAQDIANHFDVGCTVIDLNGLANNFDTSLAEFSDKEIPEDHKDGVPNTYVPFRNTIMLSIAAGYAQSWGYQTIMYGANVIDYSGYPDCRPEYVDEMNDVLRIHGDLIIQAPIALLTKQDVVRLGEKLNVPWEKTWSCYRGGKKACGRCPSCQYRLLGFKGAGVNDPIEYEENDNKGSPESGS